MSPQSCLQGRLKSLHSVWKKMQRKSSSLAEVYDARALRIVVDDEGGQKQQVISAPVDPFPFRVENIFCPVN